jgi:hypothetical protein
MRVSNHKYYQCTRYTIVTMNHKEGFAHLSLDRPIKYVTIYTSFKVLKQSSNIWERRDGNTQKLHSRKTKFRLNPGTAYYREHGSECSAFPPAM